jgi:hypothetical protein
MPDYPSPGTFGMMTISDTALPITAALHTPTSASSQKYVGHQPFYALINTSAAIRYTLDGTTPVATTTGHLMAAGDTMMVYGKPAIMKMLMIREAGDSVVAITCFF